MENSILNKLDIYKYIKNNNSYNQLSLVTRIYDNKTEKILFDGSKAVMFTGENFAKDIDVSQYGLNTINEINYFIEPIHKEPVIVVCGGGYVAQAVVRLAKFLKINTIALEDRHIFANELKKCGADKVIFNSFQSGLDEVCGDSNYYVILTRGHKFDLECLEKILEKKSSYIGMMSSEFRANNTRKLLKEKGYNQDIINSISTPIGLKIDAYTPEEIAVSILGEIILVKNKGIKGVTYTQEILSSIIDGEPKVIATIVDRKGSTPCEMGTKMVFYKNGNSVGTIGGGCMEAEVKKQALHMFEKGGVKLIRIDMTGSMNDPDAMICGGLNDIMLEYIE